MRHQLTPDLLLRAYACGLFPMADSRDSPDLFWVDPELRGVIDLEDVHLPRSLRRVIRRDTFTVTVDRAFRQVMDACAEPAEGRENTWINSDIVEIYARLHDIGAAHSVECWRDGALVGGLYGVDLAAAFFGESMFHCVTDASKVALFHLIARLRAGGYSLLDTQFVTDHLARFGAHEVSRELYHGRLKTALATQADFHALPDSVDGDTVLAILDAA